MRTFLSISIVTIAATLAVPVIPRAQGIDQQEAALAAPFQQSRAQLCYDGLERQVANPAGAVENCTIALSVTTPPPSVYDQATAHLARARAYTALQNQEHARADNLEAVRLFTSMIDPQKPLLAAVFYRGQAYHALGDVDNALRDYDYVIVNNPRNAMALVDRALLLSYYRGEVLTVQADLDQALSIAPENAEIRSLRDKLVGRPTFLKQ